jgi:hypothetical protein
MPYQAVNLQHKFGLFNDQWPRAASALRRTTSGYKSVSF